MAVVQVGYSSTDLSGAYWPLEVVQTSSATGTQNNFTIDTTSTHLVLSGATPVITGLTGGRTGRIVFISYAGSGTLVLNHQDTNSTAANRIVCATAANTTIYPATWIALIYHSSRWNLVNWSMTSGIIMADSVLARAEVKDFSETINALGTGTGATSVDLELGNVVTLNNTGARTITFTNPPASGKLGSVTMIITAGASAAASWTWTNVSWGASGAPVITTTNAKIDIITFMTTNGGSSWFGLVGGQNF